MKKAGRHQYPHKFHVPLQLKDFIEKYESATKDGEQLDEEVSMAGRIMNKRASGNSLIFYDLCAEGLKVQVTAEAQAAESLEDFKATHERTRRGDIVGVRGKPGKTRKGQLSLFPSFTQILTPLAHASKNGRFRVEGSRDEIPHALFGFNHEQQRSRYVHHAI